jgi:hypothetical protein
MVGISETAYPRMKSHPTARELDLIYTPNVEELALAGAHTRRPAPRAGFLILLKTFQRLGYFPQVADVPHAICEHIVHVAGFEALPLRLATYDDTNARTRNTSAILEFLGSASFGMGGEAVLNSAATDAAATKDDLADIINVAIEELIRQRYELPGFTTILKAAQQARVAVNAGYHRLLHDALGEAGRSRVDELLTSGSHNEKSDWDVVKQEPRRPTVVHIREFTEHMRWLRELVPGEAAFAAIPDVKLRQFACEARSLDAASMRDLAGMKRYALAATLIRFQTARALDDVAEMFIKRMQKLHRLAKEALDEYHLQSVERTHWLVAILREIVIAACKSEAPKEEKLQAVTAALGDKPEAILEQCEAFGAHAGGNYLLFLARSYKGVRRALFGLADVMPLLSTSRDASLLTAVTLVQKHRNPRMIGFRCGKTRI